MNDKQLTTARREEAEPVSIGKLLDHPDTKAKFAQVLSGNITPEKMLRLCVNAIRKTPKLLECDPYSVFGAMMTAASLGLEPNTPLQHAFLIPYGKKRKKLDDKGRPVKNDRGYDEWEQVYECTFQIGYKGFIDLIYRNEAVVDIFAEAVRVGDEFDYLQGTETFLKYRKARSGRGALETVACMITVRRAEQTGRLIGVIPLEDIYKVRERSETFRFLRKNLEEAKAAAEASPNDKKAQKDLAYAQKQYDETPWVMWEDAMAVKTAIKKAANLFPLSPVVEAAIELDDLAERGRLNLRALANTDAAKDIREGFSAPVIEHQPEEAINVAVNTVEKERELKPIATAGGKKPEEKKVEPEGSPTPANDSKAPPAAANSDDDLDFNE